MDSSIFHPPSAQSVAEILTNRRQLFRPFAANGVDHQQQHARAVLKASAKFVCPLVTQRRKKFVEQIAVGRVNLNDIESRLD